MEEGLYDHPAGYPTTQASYSSWAESSEKLRRAGDFPHGGGGRHIPLKSAPKLAGPEDEDEPRRTPTNQAETSPKPRAQLQAAATMALSLAF